MTYNHASWHDALLIVPGAPVSPRTCTICRHALTACRCGSAPANNAPPLPAQRFVKRGDLMICLQCDLDVRYCRGHAPPDPANSAAERDLAKRIAECKESR